MTVDVTDTVNDWQSNAEGQGEDAATSFPVIERVSMACRGVWWLRSGGFALGGANTTSTSAEILVRSPFFGVVRPAPFKCDHIRVDDVVLRVNTC